MAPSSSTADPLRGFEAGIADLRAHLDEVQQSDAAGEPDLEVVVEASAQEHPGKIFPVACLVGNDARATRRRFRQVAIMIHPDKGGRKTGVGALMDAFKDAAKAASEKAKSCPLMATADGGKLEEASGDGGDGAPQRSSKDSGDDGEHEGERDEEDGQQQAASEAQKRKLAVALLIAIALLSFFASSSAWVKVKFKKLLTAAKAAGAAAAAETTAKAAAGAAEQQQQQQLEEEQQHMYLRMLSRIFFPPWH